MTRIASAEFRCLFFARGVSFLFSVVGLSGLLVGASLFAQDVAKAGDEPVHTLHVYANVIQIPTLVLGPDRERIATPIQESRFSVSIDNGPWFRATHVRPEGNDPISLSILLDVSGDETELMPKIGDAIAGLAPLSLTPKDHISVYALDCSLIRSLNDMPAAGEGLKVAVDRALESWMIRRQSGHGSNCQQAVHLWDAVAFITSELYKLPGRRVILAVSSGHDKGSGHSFSKVREFAQATGVAVFGLSYIPQYAADTRTVSARWSSENLFHGLCELSGGMVFFANTKSLEEMLKRFVTTVRERYIVEFPRPANAMGGQHGMLVKIAKGDHDFIRPSGISVPIPDPAVLADPTTVPSDPKLTPELGTRKVMTKP